MRSRNDPVNSRRYFQDTMISKFGSETQAFASEEDSGATPRRAVGDETPALFAGVVR